MKIKFANGSVIHVVSPKSEPCVGMDTTFLEWYYIIDDDTVEDKSPPDENSE